MFGSSKPIPFDPYGRRRSGRRFPPWLALLVIGTALGVGAVLVVQERYLPPRLSAAESIKLRDDYQAADAERAGLKRDLADTTARLAKATADRQAAVDNLAAGTASTQQMRDDMAAVLAVLPPDPRGGAVQVRAGRFQSNGGSLDYDLILTRAKGGDRPMPAVMQFTVAGNSARGTESTVALKPVAFTLGTHEVTHGSLPLPDGFKPRQTTVTILDRAGGKPLGMRVLLMN